MAPLADFFLATPLDEEWVAAKRVLKANELETPLLDGATYYLWTQLAGTGSYLIAGMPMRLGQSYAATYAANFVRHWAPANIVLLGIAGSFDRQRHQLGDVLVPESVYGYEVSSLKKGGRKYRPTGHQAAFVLWDRARALVQSSDYEAWQEECLASAEARELRLHEPPKVHLQPMASGNDVVQTAAEAKRLRAQIHEKLCGVEMEASGMFTAVYASGQSSRVLMVRGVSDFADARKKSLDGQQKGIFRRYAAENAARFVRQLIARIDLPPLHDSVDLHAVPDKTPIDFMKRGLFADLDANMGRQHLSFASLLSFPRAHPRFAIEILGRRRGGTDAVPLGCWAHETVGGCERQLTIEARAVAARPTRGELLASESRECAARSAVVERSTDDGSTIQVLVAYEPTVTQVQFRYLDEFGRTATTSWSPRGPR